MDVQRFSESFLKKSTTLFSPTSVFSASIVSVYLFVFLFGWPEAAVALGVLSVLLAVDLRAKQVVPNARRRSLVAYGLLVAAIIWVWLDSHQ